MVLRESLLVLGLLYGSEKEKERFKIRTVQMDSLEDFLGIRRLDKFPNARIRELYRVTKGLMKVFSDGLAMWRGWRTTGVLRGSM